MSLYLLFVEDRVPQQALFNDALADWNEAHADQQFAADIVGNYPDAVEALKRRRYDGALFDLRLPADGPGNREAPLGNELAEMGLHQQGIPVAIISAKPNECDPALRKRTTVRIFDKGDNGAFVAAVDWFGTLWGMMSALAQARGKIRKESAELFLERIWPSWQSYLEIAPGEDLSPVLARQFVWHLGEVMGLGGETGELWHPLESWICPPLQPNRLATGDLLEKDDQLWIVMSPPCDLANPGKIESVLLLNCSRGFPDGWEGMVEKCRTGDENQRRKGQEQIAKVFNQSAPAQHFLAPLPGDDRPVIVKFNHMLTVPIAKADELIKQRSGSVAAPFINNLIQRFGSYISRVGQPNLDPKGFAGLAPAPAKPMTDAAPA